MRARWALVVGMIVAVGVGAVEQPAARDVRLTLHEGTSMAAALSPDGRTIAIDLLGALWTLDVGGGRGAPHPRRRLRRARAGVVARRRRGSRSRRTAATPGTSGP